MALAAVVQIPGVSRVFGCTLLMPGDGARAAVAAGAAVAGSRLVLPIIEAAGAADTSPERASVG